MAENRNLNPHELGLDPREPFLDGPEIHEHDCPDCKRRWSCDEIGDGSDVDCRWHQVVACPECLRVRNIVHG